MQKGSQHFVSFPELTVTAGNIDDVEIISNYNSKKSNNTKPKTTDVSSTPTYNPNQSVHATPSVYASKTQTFPSGNARHNLPREEFDFAANLARFDKVKEFKKIQSEDLIPKDERLVAINSPQRKLGVHENVLENSTKNKKSSMNPVQSDEIMDKFKHLSIPPGKIATKILVEEGSESEENEEVSGKVSIPMMETLKFETLFNSEIHRTISALNFSHHLLAELDQTKSIVLLLGIDDPSAILLETFYHLSNHSRFKNVEIYAIFAAGGKGSLGKKIELTSATKTARKKLLALEKIKFSTNLSEIIKLTQNVTVFDALGYDGELTANATKGLTEWMKKLIEPKPSDKKIIYGIESCLLSRINMKKSNENVQLVTFGMARDTITPSLSISKSILYVDAGLPSTDESKDIFNESFVTEIEY